MTFELPRTVKENIHHFTGRTWLLPNLLEWFEQSDERMFILTGEPGQLVGVAVQEKARPGDKVYKIESEKRVE